MRRDTGIGALAAAFLLLLMAPGLVIADESGAIRGVVADPSGRPLAGATVEARHPGAGVPSRGAVTGADGTFRIPGLPPAAGYTVEVSLPGYARVILSDAIVRAREATRVDVTLSPETELRQAIEVRASPQVVSLEETTTQTHFSAEFVDNLPLFGRNYQDVLTLAPGVTDIDGDGNPNIHGARDTDVVTLVDGVSTTDPLTGKVGAQLNIESIQDIEVKTAGASAEFGRAQGGFANIVTKSGGNEFEGMFKFFWRGSALDGDGAGIDDPLLHGGVGEVGLRDLSFDDYLPFLSLSGPIDRDHAWYFVALEYISKEEPINAVSAAFVTGLEEFRGFAKATWQVQPNARLSLTINRDPQKFLNKGLNGLTREETGYTLHEGGTNVTLRVLGVLSPQVVLEGAVAHFDSVPSVVPNLGTDTNGNGILYYDRNDDAYLARVERDPGDDWDGDGAWDVWEDTIVLNGRIDGKEVPDPSRPPFGTKFITEDVDGDGRLTAFGGCEGALREDTDCDGHLDDVDEDPNGNNHWDAGEADVDGDHRQDRGTEDRNGDGALNDAPFPTTAYPYGKARPATADRDYLVDEGTGIISGPYFETWDDQRRRETIRSDLGVFVAGFRGTHDIRTGFALERESFNRSLERNDVVARLPFDPGTCTPAGEATEGCTGGRPEGLIVLSPAERSVAAEAEAQSGALYVQDLYKPLPNLSLGLGVRFDRELARAPGYTFFDPRAERDIFDRLTALSGGELGRDDLISGNRDGLANRGLPSDPIFLGAPDPRQAAAVWTEPLRLQAIRRLTRHRSDLPFTLSELTDLYPDLFADGELDAERLSAIGVTVQQEQSIAITNNNLSPRLSVAWDPAGDGRTKLFATWGRYYDKLFLSTVTGEQGPDLLARYYKYDRDGVDTPMLRFTGPFFPSTPNSHAGQVLSKAPPSVRQIDRGLSTPFSDEWTIGFEREVAPEVSLMLRVIHRSFRDQLQDVDVNHETLVDPASGNLRDGIGIVLQVIPPHPPGTDPQPFTVHVPDGKPDLYIQNPFFNQVLQVGNYNEAEYSAFEIELRRRLARRWEVQGSYTYSRAQGQAEDFQSRAGNDPSIIESADGYLDYDQRHIVKANVVMFLPRDWQAGVTTSWASGLPYSVISRFFAADSVAYPQFRTRYGFTDFSTGRPTFVPMPRNSERNDAVFDLNLSARKNFVIGRNVAAISLEVFNLLNSDDLRVYTYEPAGNTGFDLDSRQTIATPLQLNAERRFGRRWQIGFQFAF